ncbi:MAG: ABC transporter permease subunit [Candidatus Aminicenantes bacterium]|nr:ABC transporter permease subunit [Candidatus Aminicenantes bacterium]
MRAAWRAAVFFFGLGRRAKRTKVFFALGLVPVLLSLLFRMRHALSIAPRGFSGEFFYSNVILPFYVQFLVLMLALFFGTSVVLEEVEGRTLAYLLTRPLSRPAAVLGKFAASAGHALAVLNIGLFGSFLILKIERAGDPSAWLSVARDSAVLDLSLLCYLSLFTLMGTFVKRAIFFGLLFCFGWENVIAFFPGLTQKLAIAHYVKSLIPQPPGQTFSFLRLMLEPSPPLFAVLILAGLTVVFLAAAGLVFSQKEYVTEN